jgi:hypothetical protein
MNTRLRAWGAGLALAGLVLALAPPLPDGADVVQAVAPGLRRGAAAPGDARPAAAARRGETGQPLVPRLVPRAADEVIDPGRLWGPAAAPPLAAARPEGALQPAPALAAPAPAAPALPYRVIGRYADGDQQGVILLGPDGQVVIAQAGEKLGDQYRVETIVGNAMVLTYLPLNLPQTLDIGITR